MDSDSTKETQAEKLPQEIYPKLNIKLIQNPNRFYATPIIGFLIKFLITLPQIIEIMFIGIALFFIQMLINPFIVLFTGKYWNPAYNLTLGIMKLSTKYYFYLGGLTDKYPGFDFSITDFMLEMVKPENPSRLFAFPLIGGIIRITLLIPYLIYESVLNYGAWIGVMASSIPVLFMGKYPESTYEFTRDSIRVSLASSAYMAGFSDKYPSFYISMNHKIIKIILIILGALFFLGNMIPKTGEEKIRNPYPENYYSIPQNIELPQNP